MRNSLRLTACALLAGGFALGSYVQSYADYVKAAPGAAPAMPAVPTVPSVSKSFHATLSGKREVPPVLGGGKGAADFKLDAATKTLTWTVSYSGLTGAPVAAHIHGPALPGANAGVEVPIPVGNSPMTGSAVLTDAQISDLSMGKTYVNIHTAANKGGEIRGQIVPKK